MLFFTLSFSLSLFPFFSFSLSLSHCLILTFFLFLFGRCYLWQALVLRSARQVKSELLFRSSDRSIGFHAATRMMINYLDLLQYFWIQNENKISTFCLNHVMTTFVILSVAILTLFARQRGVVRNMNRKFWENIIHQNTFFQFQTNLSTNNSLVGLRFANFRLFQSRNYFWTFL